MEWFVAIITTYALIVTLPIWKALAKRIAREIDKPKQRKRK